MSEVKSWSATAASNNSASPDGFPEGMAPSGVNDSAREVMAALARYRADTDGVNTSAGSANAYTLAASTTYAAYAQGDRFCFKSNFANTGAATLNVDSVGAKTIKKMDGTDLAANDISSGAIVDVVYDGTNFQLVSAIGAVPYRNVNTLTAAPGTGDDSADGYQPGSLAVDVTGDQAYVNVDASAAAAKWRPIGNVVLQIVYATDAGSSHSSSTYSNLNGASVSITPKSAASKILVEVSFHGAIGIASGNTEATFQIYETPSTGIGPEPQLASALAAIGAAAEAPCCLRAQVNSSGTSARAFALQGKQAGGAAVSATSMVWTITEYAA